MAKVKQEWPRHEWPEKDTGRYGPKPNPFKVKKKTININIWDKA